MILETGVVIFSLLGFAVYYGSMKWLYVKHEKLGTGKLNQKGIKILHISDLHSNKKEKLHINIWEAIEKLEFDIVAITGDIVQDYTEELKPHIPYIKALAEKAPVYFVEGNHEGKNRLQICAELRKIGVTVLQNTSLTIAINGNDMEIVGLKDYYMLEKLKLRGLHQLFGFSNSINFKLVLSHQPQIIEHIKKYKPDLVLSGHTHGGQVRLPLLPALFAPGQGLFPKYDHGWYKIEESHLYISKGIGATHFPIRFYNRPEIAVIHCFGESG